MAGRRDRDFVVCSSRILVGAPQAAGQGPLRGSRPGALFRCPITPEEYDCERVDIDGEGGWVEDDASSAAGTTPSTRERVGLRTGLFSCIYF